MSQVIVRQCVRVACSFRFPANEQTHPDITCPKCGSNTIKINTYPSSINSIPSQVESRVHLEGYLDNLRSVFNVGSIFRSSDGCGIKRLHLGGFTPSPSHPRMAKTALGSDMQIPWEQHWNGVAAIDKIKVKGYHLIGLEYTQNSKLLFDINFTPVTPCLLIAGNENFGIDPDILAQCDQTVHIPMAGIKQSLNVAIAFSIAAYWILYGAG